MYQPLIVNIFMGEIIVSILLLIIIVLWLIYKPKNVQSGSEFEIPICRNPICEELEPLMKNLIVKRLDFNDDTNEVVSIKEHLEKMKNEVHKIDLGF